MYFIQVYLPSSNHGLLVFKKYLEALDDIVYRYSNFGKLILMGDFNAHLQGNMFIKLNDARSKLLLDFLTKHNMVAIDTMPFCKGAISSFVSYCGNSESLIDHVICPVEICDTVVSCNILEDIALNVSNHRPVVCTFKTCDVDAFNGSKATV